MIPQGAFTVGIDTGGTFTDVMVLDRDGGTTSAKVPTTPGRVEGIVVGLDAAAGRIGVSLTDLLSRADRFVYGTTVATNAILERSADGRAGCLVTEGFRDTLFLRRGIRRSIWDCQEPFPEPFVRRAHTREVPERVDAEGAVVVPLDLEATRREIDALLAERRLVDGAIDALAVCFIHSYANPDHERRVAELIRREHPEVFVSASVDVAPEIREYERLSTTVFNAYVGHVAGDHFRRLEDRLGAEGMHAPIHVMQSGGGIAGVAEVSAQPVTTLFSGPAAGIQAAALTARALGLPSVIAVDMGGTSFDVGLVRGGMPALERTGEIAGWALMGERIEIHSIGAGGGTLARMDEQGLLRVGPASAGAVPGPACYGRGGTEPTVTDADLVLGYIDPGHFLGGGLALDREAAQRAVRERIAEPLGMDLLRAASGIELVARAHMVNAMRVLTVERGLDPREFVLLAYGGAGPTHAGAMLADLGLRRMIVPRRASTFSAFGLLAADLRHAYARSARVLLDRLDPTTATLMVAGLRDRALAAFAAEDVPPERVELRAAVDLSYVGQLHELTIPLPGLELDAAGVAGLRDAFAERYRQAYGFSERLPVQLVTYRLEAVARVPRAGLARGVPGASTAAGAVRGERMVFFDEAGCLVRTPVYDGERLAPGHVVEGPSVVEYPDTTLVIRPGQRARWDDHLNAVVDVDA